MARKNNDTGETKRASNRDARLAQRELRKATRGMSEDEAQVFISENEELSSLKETAQKKTGNKTGPRPQGLSKHMNNGEISYPEYGAEQPMPRKKDEKNIDGLARRAMRTAQEHALGVKVVAALLTLSNEWSFRSGAPNGKISIGAKNGHGKLRRVFLNIDGIPPLPPSALSKSGESIVLQRHGNPHDIVSIPCLTDQNQGQRGTSRQLSRQESEGIAEKIGIHPTELVEKYKAQFDLNGPE